MVGQELLHTGRLDIYLEIVETDVVIVIVWHILSNIYAQFPILSLR